MSSDILYYMLGSLAASFSCGYAASSAIAGGNVAEGGEARFTVFFYVITLGMCFAFGLLTDRFSLSGRLPSSAGLLLAAFGLLFVEQQPVAAEILTAAGCAAFAAGGAADAASSGDSTRFGMFASPLVPGVAAGIRAAESTVVPVLYPFMILVFSSVCIFAFCAKERSHAPQTPESADSEKKPVISSPVPAVPVVFAAAMFTSFALFSARGARLGETEGYPSLIYAAAAAAGCLIGGAVADTFGRRELSSAAVLLGAGALALSGRFGIMLAASVFFISFAFPPVAGGLASIYAKHESFAFGTVMLGILAGRVIFALAGAPSGAGVMTYVRAALVIPAAAAAFLILPGKRKKPAAASVADN